MPTIYEIWVILNSPVSINCVARLIRISLINSIGANPVSVFSFLKKTERLTASSRTKSSTTSSPLSMFCSINPTNLSINLRSLGDISRVVGGVSDTSSSADGISVATGTSS